jgi:ABC-type glycerol-3-phosphate transport system substrate-binding protein
MRAVKSVLPRLVPLACLALAACGGGSASEAKDEPMKPEDTVFGEMLEKKQEIPAAVDAATQQHMDDTRRALDAAEGVKSDEPAQ